MARKKDKSEYKIINMASEAPKSPSEEKSKIELSFSDNGAVNFKKTMNGYKPAEVDEYVETLNANLANAQQVFDAQSADLKSNLAFVSRERDKLKEDLAAFVDRTQDYEKKCASLKEAVEEAKKLAIQNKQLQEQVNTLFFKLESLKNLAMENRNLKGKAAEIDFERKQIDEQKALLNAEIAELREMNTRQVYDFAEQKKCIEAQYLNDNLRRAELMQLHMYHMKKSDDLLGEVVKQFGLAKKSLDEMETK